jgi:hypothetical protein
MVESTNLNFAGENDPRDAISSLLGRHNFDTYTAHLHLEIFCAYCCDGAGFGKFDLFVR